MLQSPRGSRSRTLETHLPHAGVLGVADEEGAVRAEDHPAGLVESGLGRRVPVAVEAGGSAPGDRRDCASLVELLDAAVAGEVEVPFGIDPDALRGKRDTEPPAPPDRGDSPLGIDAADPGGLDSEEVDIGVPVDG